MVLVSTKVHAAEHAAARREAKTMRELKIQMGPLFYFDMPLVLTTLEALLVQSTNLLVVK